MIGRRVKLKMERDAREKRTRLILALDTTNNCERRLNMGESFEFTSSIIEATRDYVVGIKIGYPLIIKLGLELIAELIDTFDGVAIADIKLADTDNTNKLIIEELFEADFDGVIAHAFQGKDTLKPVAKLLDEFETALFLIASMSNPDAKHTFDKAIDYIIQTGLELEVTGFIAPATRPEEIKYIRDRVGDEYLILSPGIGAQGGRIKEALSHGSDYFIVGRSIYCSRDPREAAMRLAEESYSSV